MNWAKIKHLATIAGVVLVTMFLFYRLAPASFKKLILGA
jgi:hypothetical protein